MILDTLFPLLQSASFGAFAVSLDQRILFWNRAAERILGHSSPEVLGRGCSDVMGGRGLTPECAGGCSSIRYVRSGLIPPPTRVLMLRSSGERMWVSVTPAVISGGPEGGPLLLYFFEDGEGNGKFRFRRNDSVREAQWQRALPKSRRTIQKRTPDARRDLDPVPARAGSPAPGCAGLGDDAHCGPTRHQSSHGAQPH